MNLNDMSREDAQKLSEEEWKAIIALSDKEEQESDNSYYSQNSSFEVWADTQIEKEEGADPNDRSGLDESQSDEVKGAEQGLKKARDEEME